jgi:hypothetical protein
MKAKRKTKANAKNRAMMTTRMIRAIRFECPYSCQQVNDEAYEVLALVGQLLKYPGGRGIKNTIRVEPYPHVWPCFT